MWDKVVVLWLTVLNYWTVFRVKTGLFLAPWERDILAKQHQEDSSRIE